jgi:putative aldouronate transport system permease protein
MLGISIAFVDFQFNRPIWEMPFVGLKHFRLLLGSPQFWQVFRNTILISLGRLVIEFPVPIILALLLNEVRRSKVRRAFQTVFTFPHFLSWVIVAGIVNGMLLSDGVVNQLIAVLGGQPIPFFLEDRWFLALIFGSNIWKEAGWSAIIYLAAIAGINPELYASAAVDGANRWQSMWAITWPAMRGTVVVLFILSIGQVLNAGGGAFDQIFNLYNPAVYDVADIIDTYIYRVSFQQGANFGYTTAVGLFKSVIAFVLVVIVNRTARLIGEEGLF